MSNNPDRQGPAFAGHWTECSPNSLYMTDHIGELTVSDGRKWGVSGSLNGLAIFVSTDLSYAAEVKPRHGGIDHRRFMLDTGPLIKELAAELFSSSEPKNAEDSANVERSFSLEWIAGARPPAHPEPMRGRQSFPTFDLAIAFMRRQAPDAQFVSLTERIKHSADRTADARAALSTKGQAGE